MTVGMIPEASFGSNKVMYINDDTLTKIEVNLVAFDCF